MSNFWDLVWLMLSTFIFVSYLIIMFQVVVDLFRDTELGGGSKVLWIIGLIFLPVLTAILYIIASGAPGWGGGMGSNGWGEGYGGGYSMTAALVFEFVMTFIFVTVILGATGSGAAAGFAGLAIGLTLAAIHLVGIHVTGVSVNPARSIGPALFEGGRALSQLWLFIVAPLAGGAVAGLVHAAGLTRAED